MPQENSSSDTLELWVLNRPKEDLLPAKAKRGGAAAIDDAPERPGASALLILGIGSAEPCALRYAQAALDGLGAGQAPLHVVASVLDTARRSRWVESTRSLSAILKSSSGEFGGIQSSPPETFGSELLEQAVERHALLDGRRAWRRSTPTSAQDRELEPNEAPCEAGGMRSLEGPLAILLRNAEGSFFGGVVAQDPPADAGVVSLMTQYGVSLAIGPAGGVALISDCESPPPDRVAERIYASDNWALATAASSPRGSCGMGHAILTSDRAWATTGSPLAWAVANANPPALQAIGQAPSGSLDAGLKP
jgi:hypothetical protein